VAHPTLTVVGGRREGTGEGPGGQPRWGAGKLAVMIVVVAGVSGSGKTTVGSLLAGRMGWPFTDADALHPAANIAKMRAGHPLSDADRGPWLAMVAARMDGYASAGESAVLACSALKRSYRRQLLAGRPAARMVLLHATREVLDARLRARHGHFFPATLLDSQLADVESPQPAEHVLVVDAALAPEEAVDEIVRRLRLSPPREKMSP
jgi:gluconokinase